MNSSPSRIGRHRSQICKAIEKRILDSRQYRISRYDYFVWPYKGIEPLPVDEMVFLVREVAKLIPDSADMLFSFMTDGDLIASPLSQRMNLPLIVARDHHYRMPERIEFMQRTGYFGRKMYFRRPNRNARICIVDAIISRGGTVLAAHRALEKAGIEVAGVVACVGKRDEAGMERIRERTGVVPRVLWELSRDGGQMTIRRAVSA